MNIGQALETKNLVKRFEGVHALDSLSIAIQPGQVTGIVGPNGSGKTTLINVVTGMLPLDSGTVMVSGVTLRRIVPHEVSRYGLTRTFQDIRLFEQMSVLDNILVVLTERNVFSALFEAHTEYHLKRAEHVLEEVGLKDKRHALARNLSYGQRKLLEIARVLAMEAKVIFLDEPFAGLFPEMVKRVTSIVQALKSRGTTVVLVEHNMEIIRELADYLIVMDSGQLLAAGEPMAVLKRRDVIEAYLGE